MSSSIARLFFVLLFVSISLAIDVYPDYKSTDCDRSTKTNSTMNISIILPKLTSNNVLILREPGCYWLSVFHMIEKVANISIVGYGSDPDDYSIHCSENVGLAFAQIEDIQIKNVSIIGCGISASENIDKLSRMINKTVNIFYKISPVIGHALVLSDCSDVIMDNVVIKNTLGLGLVIINIIGNSTFNNLSLLNNWAPTCFFTEINDVGSQKTIGGGMFVLYQDYKDKNVSTVNLFIKNVYAYNNSFCQFFTLVTLHFGNSRTADKIGHVAGSASGVGITLGQMNYAVNVLLASSIFKNNTGWEARSVAIVTYAGIKQSKVILDNCTFIKNGFKDYSYRPYGVITAHAALLVIKNAKFPRQIYPSDIDKPSLVLIKNSLFSGNSAENCGNIEVLFFQPPYLFDGESTVVFSNSVMTMNQGSIGPVLCSSLIDSVPQFSEVSLQLNDINVHNNRVTTANGNLQYSLVENSGQMVLVGINVLFSGYTQFRDNVGPGIISVSSNIFMTGSLLFHRNTGNFGGALQLLQESVIVLKNNTNLEITENCAIFKGGGIYFANYADYATSSKSDCFIYFDYIDVLCNFSSCPNISQLNISVLFANNTAVYGGTIFGSTLNDCPWYYDYKKNNSKAENCTTALQMLSLYDKNFNFDPPLDTNSVVSDEAIRLSMKQIDDVHSKVWYNSSQDDILVYPGERLYFKISAYDSFNYPSNALILAASSDTTNINASLSESVYWYVKSTDLNGSTTPIDIYGIENTNTTIEVFSNLSPASTSFNVKLLPCGIGFKYDKETKQCTCSVINTHVVCDIKNQTLTVGDNYWFGPVPQLNNNLVYHTCYYDYCKPGIKTFKPDNLDSQCSIRYNRTGLACSDCQANLSTIFASSNCWRCDSNLTLLLIPLFGVAGILVIIFVAFLDISVAEGYLGGFIFYCNCLNYFLPYVTPTYPIDYVFILASWVNLDVGIQSCFYPGMTELEKVGLRYIFPAYLYLLMFLVVILARYSKRFASIPFSASKTFATLFLLTYFSISGTSITLLGFSRIAVTDEMSGDKMTYYGWYADITQPYGQGLHGFFVFLASVLVVTYILPIPILLMFPSLLYRFPYTYKVKPILDAFWNPYKPSFRFWLGARSLFRILTFFIGVYVKFPTNVFSFLLIITLGFFIQERLSPYDGFLRNTIDSFFILNLIILLIGNIHYQDRNIFFDYYKTIVYVTVLSAYAVFAIIILIHMYIRFKWIQKCVFRAKDCLRRKKPKHSTTTILTDSDSDEDIRYPTPVTFTEFREPLLDGHINGYSSVDSTRSD